MPKSLADYTQFARDDLGPDVVAATPITHPESRRAAVLGGAAVAASSLVPPVAGFPLIGVVLFIFAVFAGREFHRAPFQLHVRFGAAMAVFHQDRVDLHSTRLHALSRRPRRLGPVHASHPLHRVRYRRTQVAVDTRLEIAGSAYTVHGWLERDLRHAIGDLGVALEPLPHAHPDPSQRPRQ